LSIQTTFVYTHYTLVRVSFILNNITLITIVILVLYFIETPTITRYHAIVEYAETIAPSGDYHRRILTHPSLFDAP